ncbi:MAG: DUF192 domain-containing protein [Chloroflexota bacterium]
MELRTAEGREVGWRLQVAGGWIARARGLMGRRSLGPSEGLLLPGTNSIHMLFMRFPIDCLFLGAPRADGSREVVGVREHLAPWRGVVWWVRGARSTVELPAGSLAAAGVRRGDYVRLEPAR